MHVRIALHCGWYQVAHVTLCGCERVACVRACVCGRVCVQCAWCVRAGLCVCVCARVCVRMIVGATEVLPINRRPAHDPSQAATKNIGHDSQLGCAQQPLSTAEHRNQRQKKNLSFACRRTQAAVSTTDTRRPRCNTHNKPPTPPTPQRNTHTYTHN